MDNNRLPQCIAVTELLNTLEQIVHEVAMRPHLGEKLLRNMKEFESCITIGWSAQEVEGVATRLGIPLTKFDVSTILHTLERNHDGNDGISWATISDTITNCLPNAKAAFSIDVGRFFRDDARKVVSADELAILLDYGVVDQRHHELMETSFCGEHYTLVLNNDRGFAFKWFNASNDFILKVKEIDFDEPLETVKALIAETDLRFK